MKFGKTLLHGKVLLPICSFSNDVPAPGRLIGVGAVFSLKRIKTYGTEVAPSHKDISIQLHKSTATDNG